MMEPNRIGDKIKELRLRSAISQEELAELSGLTARSIQRIENDKTVPRGDSLKRIARALNVDIEELTGDKGMPNKKSPNSLKADAKISLILILSVFGFLLNPVLAIVFPSIVWIMYKKQYRNLQNLGLKIIRLELIWFSIFVTTNAYIFCNKFFHLNLPVPDNSRYIVVFMIAMYAINFILILIFLNKWIRENKAFIKV